jgi:hypothetical protein
MRHDEPLDLAALHSEVPLRDSDYAAIRARVRAEIARREQRRFLPLFIRFALAAMIVALVAVLVVPRRRETVVPQVARQRPMSAPAPVRTPPPLLVQRAEEPPAPARVQKVAARPKRRAPKRSTSPVQTAQSMRIEMQTADPDVRIIWIVQPETPKESS